MEYNCEQFDDYNSDDYDTAQSMCLDLWMEYPVLDTDDNVLGYCTIDGEGYYW